MPIAINNVEGTHSHTAGVTELDVFELTSTQNNIIKGIWLDLNELTQNATIRVKYMIDGTTYRTFDTINWTTGMDDGVLIEGEIPIDDDFKVTLQSIVTEGATRSVPYEYWYMGIGTNSSAFVYTLTSSGTGLPIADADIWVSQDASGSNIIASGRTNALGQFTTYLENGTYYYFRQKSGYNWGTGSSDPNPDVEIVS